MSAVEKQVWTGTVTEELHEVRFDKVVATLFPDVSRTHFVFLIDRKSVV